MARSARLSIFWVLFLLGFMLYVLSFPRINESFAALANDYDPWIGTVIHWFEGFRLAWPIFALSWLLLVIEGLEGVGVGALTSIFHGLSRIPLWINGIFLFYILLTYLINVSDTLHLLTQDNFNDRYMLVEILVAAKEAIPLGLQNNFALLIGTLFIILGDRRARDPLEIQKLRQDPEMTNRSKRLGKADTKKAKLLFKAEKYLENGRTGQAAALLEKLGGSHAYRAGRLFEQVGNPKRANQAFRKAARYYKAEGNLLRQGDSLFYAADYEEAAKVYEAYVQKHKKRLGVEQLQDVVSHWGECYFMLERYEEAGNLFAHYQLYNRAGESFSKAGFNKKAAEYYDRGGLHQDASKLYQAEGYQELAGIQKGKSLFANGEYLEAARVFELAKGFDLAAGAYIKAGRPGSAADCMVNGAQWEKAAELFLELGKDEKAMHCYAKMNAFPQAAQLAARLGLVDRQAYFLEQAGMWISASKLYLSIGQISRAVTCLHEAKVSESEDVEEVVRVLTVLYQGGQIEEAHECGEFLLRQLTPSGFSAPLMFLLGDIKVALGQMEEASDLFFRVAWLCPSNETYVKRARSIGKRIGRRFTLEEGVIPKRGEPAPLEDDAQVQSDDVDNEDHSTQTLDENTVFDLIQGGELDRYEMIQELGRGGMGFVYKARDKKSEKLVAFKMLNPSFNKEPNVVLFFKREVKAVASLNHENIVALYDAGYQKGKFYLVLEYVEGQTLERLRLKHPDYIRRNLLGLWYQACLGLQCAHRNGILHRDLKPGNLMVAKDRVLKIMDFGLAKSISDSSKTLKMWGTPTFMAPELVLGGRASFQSDIYALGISFYILATNTTPFVKEGPSWKFLNDGLPADPCSFNKTITPELSRTLLKCLFRDPRKRYQSVAELIKDLKVLAKSGKKHIS